MKLYLGFDDTDHPSSDYGTGKVVRWFQERLPDECRCRGVVRQQLLVNDSIPYTSHNSAACMIVEIFSMSMLNHLVESAVTHIKEHAAAGSDPGLCVALADDPALEALVAYGYRCTRRVSNQKEALAAAKQVHLSGHGGTNDGIIGAAAAVGLTHSGWAGRFIEWDNLRAWSQCTTVEKLRERGIEVVSVDRDAMVPAPNDTVLTNGWLRPRLIGDRPVLLAKPAGPGLWENLDRRRRNKNSAKL